MKGLRSLQGRPFTGDPLVCQGLGEAQDQRWGLGTSTMLGKVGGGSQVLLILQALAIGEGQAQEQGTGQGMGQGLPHSTRLSSNTCPSTRPSTRTSRAPRGHGVHPMRLPGRTTGSKWPCTVHTMLGPAPVRCAWAQLRLVLRAQRLQQAYPGWLRGWIQVATLLHGACSRRTWGGCGVDPSCYSGRTSSSKCLPGCAQHPPQTLDPLQMGHSDSHGVSVTKSISFPVSLQLCRLLAT